MTTRKRSKKARTRGDARAGKRTFEEVKSPPANDDEEHKMDFGGLPDRDLKKNLGGCG